MNAKRDGRDKVNNVFRSLRFPKEMYRDLETIAEREHRTVTNLVLLVLENFIKQEAAKKE